MTRHRGPGVEWLAGHTGKDPHELAASAVTASAVLADAAHELAALAARLESSDPSTRKAAQAEADELRRQIAAAPSPSVTFGRRVAEILRDATECLDQQDDKEQ